ncbi:MAG TPA: BrnT family toxin [Bdellovibrionota bacterium]|nr:BrnT family toxin [Bdellovibrionota bacterium]
MNFEHDPEKSEANRKKHGIDFLEAEKLWEGPCVEFAARSEFDNRFALFGSLGRQLYTCIYTVREDRIRIISCRRAREKEVRLYEKSFKKT